MHVLIDARMVTGTTHGIARYVLNLISSLQKTGLRVTALVASESSRQQIERWTGHKLSDAVICRYKFQHPLAALEVFQYLRSLKSAAERYRKATGRSTNAVPDVLHFTSYSVPLILPLTGFADRTVVTMHDLIHILPVRDPVSEVTKNANLAHKVYFRTVVEPALRSCRAIISVSQWTKRTLIEKMSMPEKKIQVIPNGLEPSWFRALSVSSGELRKKFGLSKPYVVCVSNTKPHKNVLTLMRACAQIWAELPEVILEDNKVEEGQEHYDFDLVLAVGESELPIAWGEDWRQHPRVKVITGLSEQELQQLYASALCTVQPSQYEGYSFPVAETLAVGGTILASRTSAHIEFENLGGHFYEPFDSPDILAKELKRVLKTRAVRAPKAVTKGLLTEDEMAAATLEIYKTLKG